MYKAVFEKFPQIFKLVNWPIRIIIANIPKTITGVTSILMGYDTIA